MKLLKTGKFRTCLRQHRNVGIGISPEREELCVLVAACARVAPECISASKTQVRESVSRVRRVAQRGVIDQFLELFLGFRSLSRGEECLSAKIDPFGDCQFVGDLRCERRDGARRVAAIERQERLYLRQINIVPSVPRMSTGIVLRFGMPRLQQ